MTTKGMLPGADMDEFTERELFGQLMDGTLLDPDPWSEEQLTRLRYLRECASDRAQLVLNRINDGR